MWEIFGYKLLLVILRILEWGIFVFKFRGRFLFYSGSIRIFFSSGAEGRTRTGTACATTTSRWRVYQFHHFGIF